VFAELMRRHDIPDFASLNPGYLLATENWDTLQITQGGPSRYYDRQAGLWEQP
jgi:hypothetical protein